MSRVQFMRQMLPRICKDFYEMEIYHNPLGLLTFDPSITTSISTVVIWQTEAGTTVTIGTSHDLSYTPTAGPKKCTVTVRGGLGLVTAIDANADSLKSVKNLIKCSKCAIIRVGIGSNTLTIRLSDCVYATTIRIPNEIGCSGSLAEINRAATFVELPVTSVTGSLTDLPATIADVCFLNSCAGIAPGSIAHLTAIRDLRIYSMGWDAAGVDTVLLSASDAVWTNADHYTYSSPSMQIGGTNAVPGGSAGANTTDPLVTPGSGNSNSDWQWDAGKSAHQALTGKAAVYYLTHLTTHTWAITYAA